MLEPACPAGCRGRSGCVGAAEIRVSFGVVSTFHNLSTFFLLSRALLTGLQAPQRGAMSDGRPTTPMQQGSPKRVNALYIPKPSPFETGGIATYWSGALVLPFI